MRMLVYSLSNEKEGKLVNEQKCTHRQIEEAVLLECGRVMANNVAYAKYRKSLLI